MANTLNESLQKKLLEYFIWIVCVFMLLEQRNWEENLYFYFIGTNLKSAF